MPDEQDPKKQWVDVEKYVQLGMTLPAATFIGWALGTLIDHWLHTHWIYIVGLLLGIVAGFVQFIRVALSAESKD
ncbi:MAG TPA: AtpZ/AtpI family protein [Candidatus Solibacter sp.]|jgi:F0F1-type ATP synthase assembly protein I|nr:AtpZ/AtpI family protein [Candidatus Solibacter sp.]